MKAFSGTNLPPILRLGGTADSICDVHDETTNKQSTPRYVPFNYYELPIVAKQTVELPISKSKKSEPKGNKKATQLRARRK